MANKKEKINASIIIATNNSQDTLCNTLEGLKDFDEIIVVDTHSTDDTIEIAKEYKTKIIFCDKFDLSNSLNQAILEAQNDWIVFIEDDEITSNDLISEIKNYIINPKKNRFCISFNQKTFFNNIEFKPAYKKDVLRVFKKEYANFDKNTIEIKKLQGKIYRSKKTILKYTKLDIEKNILEIIDKNKHFIKNTQKLKKPSFGFLKTFLYWYFIKGSCFCGKKGYIFSYLKSFEEFNLNSMIYEKEINTGDENDF